MNTDKPILPLYAKPPVVEVAISVQFARLQSFTGAHAGWFWKTVLDPANDAWPRAKMAPRIEDQFERFGDDRRWGFPAGFSLRSAEEAERVQLHHRSEERMIQLQDSRFAYNWRKGAGDYPSYDALRPEFSDGYGKFREFSGSSGLGEIEENQWEITYVNHIPTGELWEEPRDWQRIIPSLYVPMGTDKRVTSGVDAIAGQWQVNLASNRGRLHVTLHHGRVGGAEGPDVLVLQLLARGPIDPAKGHSLLEGLALGHEAIVGTFDAMTSESAHRVWGRRE